MTDKLNEAELAELGRLDMRSRRERPAVLIAMGAMVNRFKNEWHYDYYGKSREHLELLRAVFDEGEIRKRIAAELEEMARKIDEDREEYGEPPAQTRLLRHAALTVVGK